MSDMVFDCGGRPVVLVMEDYQTGEHCVATADNIAEMLNSHPVERTHVLKGLYASSGQVTGKSQWFGHCMGCSRDTHLRRFMPGVKIGLCGVCLGEIHSYIDAEA